VGENDRAQRHPGKVAILSVARHQREKKLFLVVAALDFAKRSNQRGAHRQG
jgi:hypothetical protein